MLRGLVGQPKHVVYYGGYTNEILFCHGGKVLHLFAGMPLLQCVFRIADAGRGFLPSFELRPWHSPKLMQ